MTELEAIEARIRQLPKQDFANLRKWFHRFESEALSHYTLSDDDYELASHYLSAHPECEKLLNTLPDITHRIYGKNITKRLTVTPDPDTGETMLEINLTTHLPFGPDFDAKEEQLFKAIDNAQLAAGLRNAIIIQCYEEIA